MQLVEALRPIIGKYVEYTDLTVNGQPVHRSVKLCNTEELNGRVKEHRIGPLWFTYEFKPSTLASSSFQLTRPNTASAKPGEYDVLSPINFELVCILMLSIGK